MKKIDVNWAKVGLTVGSLVLGAASMLLGDKKQSNDIKETVAEQLPDLVADYFSKHVKES
jgi:hypothetical protein